MKRATDVIARTASKSHRRRKGYKKNAMLIAHSASPETHIHQRRIGVTVDAKWKSLRCAKYRILFGNDTPEYPFPRSCKKRRHVNILVQYAQTLDIISNTTIPVHIR